MRFTWICSNRRIMRTHTRARKNQQAALKLWAESVCVKYTLYVVVYIYTMMEYIVQTNATGSLLFIVPTLLHVPNVHIFTYFIFSRNNNKRMRVHRTLLLGWLTHTPTQNTLEINLLGEAVQRLCSGFEICFLFIGINFLRMKWKTKAIVKPLHCTIVDSTVCCHGV